MRLLELTHNEIDDWKGIEALQSLKNLKQLSLRGNPIVGQPIDISLNKTESQEGSDSEDENGADAKTKLKEAKLLDAKNKQYNFKMKRLFPKLVVRDGQRVMDKKTHGYVAPPKEEKEVEKPKRKHTHTHKAKAKKSVEAGEAEHKSKHTKSHKRKRDDDANAAADDGAETPKVASPVKPVKKEVKETADKEQRQIKKSTSKTDTASGSAVIKNKVAAEGDDEAAKRKKEKNKARKETAKQKKATKDEKSAKRQPKASDCFITSIVAYVNRYLTVAMLNRTLRAASSLSNSSRRPRRRTTASLRPNLSTWPRLTLPRTSAWAEPLRGIRACSSAPRPRLAENEIVAAGFFEKVELPLCTHSRGMPQSNWASPSGPPEDL